MSALYGCSRSVLFGLAALSFVFGVTSLATVGPGEGGIILTCLGGGAIIVLLLERTRYRSMAAEPRAEPVGPGGGEPPGPLEPRFAATAEVFVDPASGHRMRVFVDPRTGDRRYVAED
jgi:hypothetical protein